MKKVSSKKSNKLSAKDKEIFELLRKAREQYEEYLRRNSYLYSTLLKKEKKVVYQPPSFENPLTDHTIKIKRKDAYQYPSLENSLTNHTIKIEDK